MKKIISIVMTLTATFYVNMAYAQNCETNLAVKPSYSGADKDKVERRSRALCRTNYLSYFDPMTKTPLWVAERVVADVRVSRVDNFQPDPTVPKPAQASLADYKGSGFDRGHMAPAADMTSDAAMDESFYLTNMVPQVGPNMNRGIWADLEKTVREIVAKEGPVYVISGPIFEQPVDTIGSSRVWVPTKLFKVIYRPQSRQMMAYIMPNVQIVTRRTKSLDAGNPQHPQTTPRAAINCNSVCNSESFRVNPAEIEAKTGWKFF